jgi:hypothetical protein
MVFNNVVNLKEGSGGFTDVFTDPMALNVNCTGVGGGSEGRPGVPFQWLQIGEVEVAGQGTEGYREQAPIASP